MRLTDLDWRTCLAPTSLLRGLDYAMEERVLTLERMDAEGLHWRGEVEGSARAPYRCEAQVIPPKGRGALRLRSHCTCPIGVNCKHVAALLWQAEDEDSAAFLEATQPLPRMPTASVPVPTDPLREWSAWLQRTQGAASVEPPVAPPREAFALVVRSRPYGDPPDLLIALAWFRRGNKGLWVDPKPVLVQDGEPSTAPADGWSAEELVDAMLLLMQAHERIGPLRFTALHGSAQRAALERLLKRFPVCFERVATPLNFAEPQTLSLRWDSADDGSQRLRAGLASPSARLLRGAGLWYLDVDAGRLGRVRDDTGAFEAARRAPVLQPEHSAALRAQWQAHAAASGLPPPALFDTPRRLDATPRLSLHLSIFHPPLHSYSRREPGPVGSARIFFDYDGLRLDPLGPMRERRRRGDELVEIVRGADAERALLEMLGTHHLISPRSLPWPTSYPFEALDAADRLLAPPPKRVPCAPEHWVETLRALAAAGVALSYSPDFPRPLREIETQDWDAELSEAGGPWFALSLGIDVEGERVDLLPILRRVLEDSRFPLYPVRGEAKNQRWRIELDDTRALLLPLAKLRALLAPLLDLLQGEGPLRLHRSQGAALQTLGGEVRWRGDAALRTRLVDLAKRPTAVSAPSGFKATLRPYQREGLAWLNLLAEAGLGGVLADDMGLGKTVQVLAHLLSERARHAGSFKTLVVAPTSLMGNWREEAARFAPALRTLVLHGPERGERFDDIATHDLILTTYPLLPRDREALLQHEFDLLVLDEAQAIKNAKSQAAQTVRELRARRRLGMTGTPLENHLGELWAQFDAIEPGLLGSEREFARLYRTPIEKHGDAERQRRLSRRIGPLLLRRRKDEVLKDLPAKTEILRALELEGSQRDLYESLRLAQHQRVREAIAERGLAQSGIVVLDALLKLRQVCCDPRLLRLPAAKKVRESAKLEALFELLDTLLAEGRRVLLFSQFTGMLDLIELRLRERDIEHLRLDGDTPGRARAGLVQKFQEGRAPLFLISLKAGGVGLNLTAADTVIHYDPWWNPAVENQATDRAHRIGQNKAVFVYKLICSGTVEEKILALQGRKGDLAQAVLEGGRSTKLRFGEDDLAALFEPLR